MNSYLRLRINMNIVVKIWQKQTLLLLIFGMNNQQTNAVMKHLFFFLLMSSLLVSCKSGTSDEDIQQRVNNELKKDRAGAALNATVDNGVATITGECVGDGCSVKVAERIRKVKGVQNVQTNIIEK